MGLSQTQEIGKRSVSWSSGGSPLQGEKFSRVTHKLNCSSPDIAILFPLGLFQLSDLI